MHTFFQQKNYKKKLCCCFFELDISLFPKKKKVEGFCVIFHAWWQIQDSHAQNPTLA